MHPRHTTDVFYKNGLRYIRAQKAALNVGLTREYVGQLCREKKVSGFQEGKFWFVAEEELRNFVLTQRIQREARRVQLAKQREREYKASLERQQAATVPSPEVFAQSVPVVLREEIVHVAQETTEPMLELVVTPEEVEEAIAQSQETHVVAEEVGIIPDAIAELAASNDSVSEMQPIALNEILAEVIAESQEKQITASAQAPFVPETIQGNPYEGSRLFMTWSSIAPEIRTPKTEIEDAVRALVEEPQIELERAPSRFLIAARSMAYRSAPYALVVVIAFGLFAGINSPGGRYALDTMRSHERAAVQSVLSLANAQKEYVQGRYALAAAGSQNAFLSVFERLARAINSSVDGFFALVYTPQTPVSVASAPPPPPPEQPAIPSTPPEADEEPQDTPAPQRLPRAQTIVERVIERVVEPQRLASVGGITEEYLNTRLQDLDNKLSGKIFSLSFPTMPMSSGGLQNQISLTQSIGSLTNTQISNPTITGGTITNASISGSDIVASSLSGTLGVGSGGTGTSTTPSYGRLLVGNSAGGYDLLATSSLGIGAGVSSPGGANMAVQFNDAGVFGGSASFSFDKNTNTFSVINGSFTNATSTNLVTTNASTTNLSITGSATTTAQNGFNIAAGCFAINGTCLSNGSAADGSFSTTSADFWKTQRDLFSTTSVNAWEATQFRWATTSTDFWKSVNNFFSTTSAQNFLSLNQGAAFSTSSAIAFLNATTSFGTNKLTGSLGTINGTTFNVGSGITITAASSTLLADNNTFAGRTTLANASTTNLSITGSATTTAQNGFNIASGCFAVNGVCITSGSAADGSFSTTSADFWKTQRDFFSTTSADAWDATKFRWATTSSDYWMSVRNFFSTTSAQYFESTYSRWATTSSAYFLSQNQGAAFSTTSASNFLSFNQGAAFSTTSASYFLGQNIGAAFSTTSVDFWKTQRDFFSTTSAQNFLSLNQGAAFSTTSATAFLNATTSFGTNKLTGSLGTVNGTNFNVGAAITVSAASSTLLSNNNSWSGSNLFSASTTFSTIVNLNQASSSLTTLGTTWFSGIVGSLLSTDSNGRVVATTSIGGNLLTGAITTINGTSITSNTSNTITAASSTLLADNNTFAGRTTLANASTTNLSITGSATTTAQNGFNIASGCFAVNGVCITSGSAADGSFSTTSADFWKTQRDFFSTTSASAFLSLNQGQAFSTSSAIAFLNSTTTFGTNKLTGSLGSINGTTFNVGAAITVSAASSTLLVDNNTWTGTNLFSASTTFSSIVNLNQASSSLNTFGSVWLPSVVNSILVTNGSGLVSGSSTLAVNFGGTGSTTLSGILKGNGTGYIQSAIAGTDYLTGSGLANNCVKWGPNNTLADQGSPCGSGSGSGGGTWATTTSQVAGQLINYSLNSSDIVTIGASATSSARFIFDPNTQVAYFSGSVGIGSTTPGASLAVSGSVLASRYVATSSLASVFPYASTTALTITGNAYLTSTTGSLLATDSNGRVVATTSVGTNLLTGSLGTINGTTFNVGSGITITAASSTLLVDNNTFSGQNIFSSTTLSRINVINASTSLQTVSGSLWLPLLTSAILTTDSTGRVVATTSIGGNVISGNITTINGTLIGANTSNTITAASSTLLANNNTWSGNNLFFASTTFSTIVNLNQASSSLTTLGTTWLTGLGGVLLSTNANGQIVATTSVGTNLLTGTLGTVNGQTLTAGGTITINAASSTLLANDNTFSGKTTLANASTTNLTITGNATTTAQNGINISGGCFSINGACISGGTPFSPSTAYTWSALQTFQSGILSQASSTFTALLNLSQASTSQLTVSGNSYFTGLTNALLTTNAGGQLVATTSIGTNYLTGSLGTINGTTFSIGSGITIAAASSTLLANNNTFSGNNLFSASTTFGSLINIQNASSSLSTFGSVWLPGLTNTILTTNSAGLVVATSSIGSNLLSGAVSVPQGGTGSTTLSGILTGNGTGAVTSAIVSSPLSFSGNTLSISQANASADGYLSSTDWTTFNGKLGSTTISGLTTNFIPKWNGTTFALNNSSIIDIGTAVGVGTSTPWGRFSISLNNGDTNTTAFVIASSTGSATTTLVSVSNSGRMSVHSNNGAGGYTSDGNYGGTGSAAWFPSGIFTNSAANNNIYGVVNYFIGPLQNNTGDSWRISATSNSFVNGTTGSFGVGTSSSMAKLVLSLNYNDTVGSRSGAFLISSSTASATTTLFQVSNTGSTTIASVLNVGGGVNATSTFGSGINILSGCFAINGTCVGGSQGSSASSTLLSDNNTFSGNNLFSASTTFGSLINIQNASSSLSTFGSVWLPGLTNTILTTNSAGLVVATSSIGSNLLSGAVSVPQGGTGSTTLSGILKGNGTGAVQTAVAGVDYATLAQIAAAYPFTGSGNSTTTLTQFNGGLSSYASTTIGSGTQIGGLTINGGATTTGNAYFGGNLGIGTTTPGASFAVGGSAYISGSLTLSNLSILLGGATTTNLTASGTVYSANASTSNLTISGVQHSLLYTNAIGQVAGTSTIGSNILNVPASSVLAGDSSGKVVATTSIGTNFLTGSLGSINGTTFNVGSGITVAAASSTLLTDINTFTGLNRFNAGLTAFASSTIGAGGAGSGLTISGGATTTGNSLISGALTVSSNIVTSGSFCFSACGTQFTASGISKNNSGVSGGATAFGFTSGNQINPSNAFGFTTDASMTTGSNATVLINPTYNQPAANGASNYDLQILRTETAIATGTQSFILAQTGGSLNGFATTTKFSVDRTGTGYFAGSVGIGTSSHASKLTIWGGAGDMNLFEAVNSASTTFLRVSNSGFGTTTLSGLSVAGSATSTSNVGFNLTSGCFAVNGTCISGGTPFSPSTAYNWSALQTFQSGLISQASSTFTAPTFLNGGASTTIFSNSGNTYLTGLTNSLLSTNASGLVVATTSIGGNLLTGGITTINGTNIVANTTNTITAASSTLLANNNTFSGSNVFSSLLNMTNGLISNASSTIGAGTQATGLTIWGGATTTGNLSVLGTGTSTIEGWFRVGTSTNTSGLHVTGLPGVGNGLAISQSGAGSGLLLQTISAATNEAVTLASKGQGTITMQYGTQGGFSIIQGGSPRFGISDNILSNASPSFSFIPVSASGRTASTEAPFVSYFNSQSAPSSQVHANGEISLQREFVIRSVRENFTSFSATNNITDLATLGIEGAPHMAPGSSGTTTNAYAILIGSSTPSTMYNASTTNSYGLGVFTSAGAQNTYSAIFMGGNVGVGTTTPGATLSVVGNIIASTTATSTFGGGINIFSGCFAVNGTCVGSGGSASSTLLFDNNTWTGNNIFGSTTINRLNVINASSSLTTLGTVWLPNLTNAILTTNASGQIVSTSSIGANYLSGTVSVANGGTASTTLGGILTGNGTGAITSAIVSGPLSFSGNTLSIVQASGAQDGYLSSADWTLFNGKVSSSSLAALYPFPLAGNATSTLTQFNGGLTAYASSTIGAGTQGAGLTISGGGTTTLDFYIGDDLTVAGNGTAAGITSPTNLTITAPYIAFNNDDLGIDPTGCPVTDCLALSSVNLMGWFNGSAITTGAMDVALSRLGPGNLALGNGALGNHTGTLVTGRLGLGTSSPYALLSVTATSTTGVNAPTTLFEIASTTAGTATTTLFKIDNRGILTSNAAATSTFSSGFQATNVHLTGSATSTSVNGFNLVGGCFSVNGTCITGGTGASVTAANTWTQIQTFQAGILSQASSTFTGTTFLNGGASTTIFTNSGNTYLTGLTNALLTTNASGLLVATTSIGGNFITGNITTINGTAIVANTTNTITAASSTLLANNNTWSGNNLFTGNNMILASTTIGAGGQATGLTIFGGATTTGDSLITGNLGVGALASAYKLNVVGTANISSSLSIGGNFTLDNSVAGLLFRSGSGPFVWAPAETKLTTGGTSLGLGTTSPYYALTAASSSGPQLALSDGSSSSGAWTLRSANNNLFLATSTYSATSSTAALSINGSNSAFTFNSGATSTFSSGLQSTALNISGSATSTFANGLNLNTGCFSVNGTCISAGSGASLSAANTWTQLQTFQAGILSQASSTFTGTTFLNGGASTTIFTNSGNTYLTGLTNALLTTNASGLLVATTSIGGNFITGNITTINGTQIVANTTNTITAASSTLLANNNTFSGSNVFSSLLNMTSGLVATASSTIGNGTQAGGLTISGGATSTGNIVFRNSFGTRVLIGEQAGDANFSAIYLNSSNQAQDYNFLSHRDGPDLTINRPSGGALRFTMNDDTNYQMLLDSSGRLGLGTTTPSWKFTSANASGPQIALVDTNPASVAWTLRSANNNLFLATSTYSATSSTAALSINGSNSAFTFNSGATSTFSSGLQSTALNISGSATSTFANGLNLNTGCFSVNGTCISAGSGASLSAANTWTQLQTFQAGILSQASSTFTGTTFLNGGASTTILTNSGNTYLTGLTNALLTTNASGLMVATTSIGTNFLTGSLGTINGQTLTAGGSITVASTTLLANNNTWSGLNIFNNRLSIGTSTSFWNFAVASSSGPQIALLDTNPANFAWTQRAINNNFYLATSTALATSSVAAFTINGTTGAITFNSGATSTFSAALQARFLNINGSGATSTFASGINLSGGCVAINGTCIGGGGGGVDGGEIYASTTAGSNGTWSAPAGLEFAQVIVTGGGGGGGGTDSPDTANESVGGGGGAGATAIEMLTAAEVGASQVVTVGAKGAAGANTGTTGGNGGNSSFGAFLHAMGGSGGVGLATNVSCTASGIGAGGLGATATTGDMNITGGQGLIGACDTASLNGGVGGSSYWGGGGSGGSNANAAASAAGLPATALGAGGGGAVTRDVTTGAPGGTGATGTVMVISYTASGGDLAEWYETKGGVEPGDVVAISDESLEYESFKLGLQKTAVMEKATQGSAVIGVVSTMPNKVMGGDLLGASKDARPIALAGRVPVKVTEINGKIRAGDKLTMSSTPGVAMRATKAGVTIGKALEASKCSGSSAATLQTECKVMILVNTSYSSGMLIKDKLRSEGVDLDAVPRDLDIGRIMLAKTLQEKEAMTASTSVSEIFTDRVVAALEVISPRVLTDTLVVDSIEPVRADVTMKLTDSGAFYIERVGEDGMSVSIGDAASAGERVVSIDALGNAFFAGALTVGTSDKPEGITLFDEKTGEPYCVKVSGGKLVNVSGACGSPQLDPAQAPAEGAVAGNSTSTPPSAEEPPADQGGDNTATSTPDTPPEEEQPPSEDTEAPVVTINGESTAHIPVGTSYSDLGATVSDNTSNNLGYDIEVDGAQVEVVQIDTSAPGTHTITYTATDGAGNSGSALRTVIVEEPQPPQTDPPPIAEPPTDEATAGAPPAEAPAQQQATEESPAEVPPAEPPAEPPASL